VIGYDRLRADTGNSPSSGFCPPTVIVTRRNWKMPRKGLYQPWTSKNCLFLMVCSSLPHNFRNWSIQSLSDEREIDWKDEFRSGDSKPTTVEAV